MLEKIEKFQILLLGLFIALGAIIATFVIAGTISRDVITVTGSYSQIVTSDRATWKIELNAREKTKAQAYEKIKAGMPVIVDYLKGKNINEKDIEIGTPSSYATYALNAHGNATNEISY